MSFNLKPQTNKTMNKITVICIHKHSLNGNSSSGSTNESVKKKKKDREKVRSSARVYVKNSIVRKKSSL